MNHSASAQGGGNPNERQGPFGPALAALEVASVARGIVAADAALKMAPTILLSSRAVAPGKHILVMHGEVASTEYALDAAKQAAGALLIDWVWLPYADAQVWPLLRAPQAPLNWQHDVTAEAVAIIETRTIVGALRASDAACKIAAVTLRDCRLATELGGNAFFTFTGTLADVQAALATAVESAGAALAHAEVVAQPAAELRGALFSDPFGWQ